MLDNLLFDLDGTLTDSFDGIAGGVMHALDTMGVPYKKSDLNFFIGPPLFDSFGAVFDGDPQKSEKVDRAVALYREYFSERGWKENRVYDGVPEMLQTLKAAGKTMVVATSKPEHFSRRITQYFNLDKYFCLVAGASLDSSRAAKAQVIEYALKTAGIDRAKAAMIGDRKHDILGAKQCGLKSIGVLYGYGSLDELTAAGADYIAKTPDDVVSIVQSM